MLQIPYSIHNYIKFQVQRFRLRLMGFDFTVTHVPGKKLHVHTAYTPALRQVDDLLCKEIHANVQMIVTGHLASENHWKTTTGQRLRMFSVERAVDKGETYKGHDARNIEAILSVVR